MNSTNFILEYEKVCAAYIEHNLDNCKIKLWADVFSLEETTKTRTQIFFGHQRTDREYIGINPRTYQSIYEKKYNFELRVELFTLKNHQEALYLIETVLDDILTDFRPFEEFSKFMPETSGNAARNKNNGSWIYSGNGTASINTDVEFLTPTTPVISESKIIKIGLFNSDAPPTLEKIGEFIYG